MTSKEFVITWVPPIMNKKEWKKYIKTERKYFIFFSIFLLLIGLIGIFIVYISLNDFYCYLLFSPFLIMPIFIISILLELKIRRLQDNPVPSLLEIDNHELIEITNLLEKFLANKGYKKVNVKQSKIKKSHPIEYRYVLNQMLSGHS